MGQLTYKIQSLEARLKRLEKENRGIETFPPFSFEINPGALQELLHREDTELLVFGGAGTGKTSACMAKVHNLCLNNPGIRVLVARKTKADLAESVLKAYEVLVLGKGHPLLKGASRYNRRSYVYPNGSRIVLGGMDASTRVMGSDYDVVYVSEATELTTEDYEFLSTRLRNGKLHFQMLLTDCNPGSPNHFLYKRIQAGNLNFLKSKHEDNPRFYNSKYQEWTKAGLEYMERFKNVSGVRFKRLREGEWTIAEGAIYAEYDSSVHILYERLPVFKQYISAMDFGHRDAGVLLTFGITKEDELILVDEVYQTGKTFEWWIGEAVNAKLKYKPQKFMCDPSRPENIMALKQKGIPAFGANNKLHFGIDLVQQRLKAGKLKFWHNSLKEADNKLKDYMQPYRLTEEIPGYVWQKSRELPEPTPDHALDCLRYVCSELGKLKSNQLPATSTSIPQFEVENVF